MKKLWMIILIILLIAPCFAQEKEKPKEPVVKSWQMPSYMVENLQYIMNEFNKMFNEKIEFYKKELKEKYKGYEDMPIDVVFNGKDRFILKINPKKEVKDEKK